MPVDYSRYPADWHDISRRIRFERAGNRCEWCGAPNGAAIVRKPCSSEWREVQGMEIEVAALVDGERVTRVVLTVAHLGTPHADGTPGDKHDKMDVRDENLAALCQRCHLLYDLDDHMRHAAETRRRRKIEAGQLAMEL